MYSFFNDGINFNISYHFINQEFEEIKRDQIMKYYTDGSGTNGKTSSYCVLSENGDVVKHITIPGNSTNNEMEYRAMIEALKICKDGDIIFSDSQLIIYQLTGVYKIKEPRLRILAAEAFEIMKNKDVKIGWIRRENNLAGIFLESNH